MFALTGQDGRRVGGEPLSREYDLDGTVEVGLESVALSFVRRVDLPGLRGSC